MRLRPSFTTISNALGPAPDSCTRRTRAGRVGPSSRSTPSRSVRSAAARRHALDLDEVLLLDAVTRMHEQLRELAVVREDEQALGVAGRAGRPRTPAACRERGRARSARPWGSLAVGDVARRLVQQPVHERVVDDDRHAVERDVVVRGIDAPAEHRDLAVRR